MKKFSCILLTTSNENLSVPIEDLANKLFNVSLISKHSWNNSKVTHDIHSILSSGTVDYLFSFLCPVIIPENLLAMTKRENINIHPAPPEYPGIGSVSRALYDEKSQYGVTAHIMKKKVDTGRIIKVIRFPISNDDTCEKLDFKAKQASINLMKEILSMFSKENSNCNCNEKWSGTVMTRKKFEKWMT